MLKKTSGISVPRNPKARSENLLVQDSTNELLVYDLITNKAFCLNETSALVWQNCDGKNTVTEIAKTIEHKLGHAIEPALIWLALDELQKENLLVGRVDAADKFDGLSRREVIRKVGLTSMIALPVISSLVAPQAFHAQTCVGMGMAGPGTFQGGGGGGNYSMGMCDPMDGLGFCAGAGANCCTGIATITCHPAGMGPVPSVAPFSCDCT